MADGVARLLAEPPAFASADVRRYAHYRSGFTLPKPVPAGSEKHGVIGPVLGKIAQRGIPAPCSLRVERYVLNEAQASGLLDVAEETDTGAFVFRCTPRREDLADLLYACCIPELLLDKVEVDALFERYRSLCTPPEEVFFNMLLDRLPDPRLGLLFLPQRRMDSMGVSGHPDERVDFALEVPDHRGGWLRLVIEIDDSSHTFEQLSKDQKRDRDLRAAGWAVYRFPLGKKAGWQAKFEPIVELISRAIPHEMLSAAGTLRRMSPRTRAALCNLIMLPVAEAQIAVAVAQILHAGGKRTLRIANPQDLSLEPVVAAVQEMVGAITALHTPDDPVMLTLVPGTDPDADLVYYGYPSAAAWDALAAKKSIVVAPCPVWSEYVEPFIPASPRAVDFAGLNADAVNVSLDHLLQNVFRKVAFRPKQREIIVRALSLRPVIGLLPTAAGKSLCYQLSSLLQPGFTFIVDPLRSLMIDQKSSLEAMGIHRCHTFMSGAGDADTKDAEVRQRGYRKMERGEFLFVFNSPERLQIPEFINLVNRQMDNITYCVVDEAHCVSEWGHDFRLAYMNIWRRMGEHAARKPVLMALTGTASQNVLIDIRHILRIYEQEAVIEPSTFDRPELTFEVYRTSRADRIGKIAQVLQDLTCDPSLASGGAPGGLIFSNFVGGDVGVTQIAGELASRLDREIPIYSGGAPASVDTDRWEQEKAGLQVDFKNDRIPLLACTHSFGMGIDKPNIRFTVHAIIPRSLEDFYQQAGRAGRDGKPARCVVVFVDEMPEQADKLLDPGVTPHDALASRSDHNLSQQEDAVRNLWFLRQTFPGTWHEQRALYYAIYEILRPQIPDSDDTKSFESSIWDFPPQFATTGEPDNASGEDRKRTFEMALHRCYLTGAIVDYAYDYTGKRFRIDLKRTDPGAIYARIREYLGKRMTESELNALFRGRVLKETYPEAAYDAGCILIDYFYETIEKRRRRAILHMLQAARDGVEQGPAAFREALLTYLEASKFTGAVKRIARSDDHHLWLAEFDRVQGMDDLTQLLGACRRQLEEYPSHPGLLILAGFCRAAGLTPEEGFKDIAEGFRNLNRRQAASKVRDEIESAVVNHTRRLMPSREPDVSRAIRVGSVPVASSSLCDPEPFDAYEEQQLMREFEQIEELCAATPDLRIPEFKGRPASERLAERYVDSWREEDLDEDIIDPDVAIQIDELRQKIRYLQGLLLDTQWQGSIEPEACDEAILDEIDALEEEIADLEYSEECGAFDESDEFDDGSDNLDEADLAFIEVSDLIESNQRRIRHYELQFGFIDDERRWRLMEVMSRLKPAVREQSEPDDKPATASGTAGHRRRQTRGEKDPAPGPSD
ncbi:RecQ family ATP-dependent DNA helicase [Methanoculleus sp.]|uniref:RecQ family ATP-dependent DNA helicase n=1 Tax=Methanoculleus sp. TaxID=90427 RepID=UPI002FC76BCB